MNARYGLKGREVRVAVPCEPTKFRSLFFAGSPKVEGRESASNFRDGEHFSLDVAPTVGEDSVKLVDPCRTIVLQAAKDLWNVFFFVACFFFSSFFLFVLILQRERVDYT